MVISANISILVEALKLLRGNPAISSPSQAGANMVLAASMHTLVALIPHPRLGIALVSLRKFVSSLPSLAGASLENSAGINTSLTLQLLCRKGLERFVNSFRSLVGANTGINASMNILARQHPTVKVEKRARRANSLPSQVGANMGMVANISTCHRQAQGSKVSPKEKVAVQVQKLTSFLRRMAGSKLELLAPLFTEACPMRQSPG